MNSRRQFDSGTAERLAKLGITTVPAVVTDDGLGAREAKRGCLPNGLAVKLIAPLCARIFDPDSRGKYPAAERAPRFVRPDGSSVILCRTDDQNSQRIVGDGALLSRGSLLQVPGEGSPLRWEVEPIEEPPWIDPQDLLPAELSDGTSPTSRSQFADPMSANRSADDPMSAGSVVASYVRSPSTGHRNSSLKKEKTLPMSAGAGIPAAPDEIDWGGWLADAVGETTPKSTKDWERRLFKFGRIVAAQIGTHRPEEELRPAADAWYIAARRTPGLEELRLEDVFCRLSRGIEKIRCPLGEPGPWSNVETLAETLQPPGAVVEEFRRSKPAARLAQLCMAAAATFRGAPFGLDCRSVGKFIGCKKSRAAELIQEFEQRRWLEKFSTGAYRRGASKYRCNFPSDESVT